MSTLAQDIVAAAGYMCDQAAPYFAKARAAMPIIFTDKVPVMGVDKEWRCYVNPKTIAKMKAGEVGFVLIHELSHCLREHARRCEEHGFEPVRHNLAADCEINNMVWEDLTMPKGKDGKPAGITAELFRANPAGVETAGSKWKFVAPKDDGLLCEEYYSNLERVEEDGDGEGEGEDGDGEDGSGSGTGKGQPQIGGSCADGVPRDYELPAEDEEQPGLSELEQGSKRLEAAQALQEHASKGHGNVPGDWERWAGTIIKPVVPLHKQFRHALCSGLSRCGLGQQTYKRVRERGDIIMPRHHRRDPVVLVCVDASGSMGAGDNSPLNRALSEMIGCCKHLGAVNAVYWDTQPHLQLNVRKASDIKCTAGGGTDPAPAIAFANQLRNGKRPDMLVIISDGICSWPAVAPKFPTVTVIIGGGSAPPWGKTIRIEK